MYCTSNLKIFTILNSGDCGVCNKTRKWARASVEITCYYVNFEIPNLVNVYDDRGMDIISLDKSFACKLKWRFFNWNGYVNVSFITFFKFEFGDSLGLKIKSTGIILLFYQ